MLADQDLYQGIHQALIRRTFWIRDLPGAVPTNPWTPAAILESPHPYPDTFDQTYTHTIPGASALMVTMHPATRTYRTSTGTGDDLYIQDTNSVDIPGSPFRGEVRGQTFRVPGDTVRIRLVSIAGNLRSSFGFRCESIVPENLANVPPVASFTASVTGGDVPFVVTFDASASMDPDGTVMTYALDPGDGSDVLYLDPAHPVAEHFYNTGVFSGQTVHTASLIVTDQHGGSHTTNVPITLLPHVPRPVYYTFADGCAGSLGVSGITPTGSLQMGTTLAVQFDNLPLDLAVVITGLSNVDPAGDPLALELSFLGMPNCKLYTTPDILSLALGSAGQATHLLALANDPALAGVAVYHQALVFDPNAGNAFGAVMSDAAGGVIGF